MSVKTFFLVFTFVAIGCGSDKNQVGPIPEQEPLKSKTDKETPEKQKEGKAPPNDLGAVKKVTLPISSSDQDHCLFLTEWDKEHKDSFLCFSQYEEAVKVDFDFTSGKKQEVNFKKQVLNPQITCRAEDLPCGVMRSPTPMDLNKISIKDVPASDEPVWKNMFLAFFPKKTEELLDQKKIGSEFARRQYLYATTPDFEHVQNKWSYVIRGSSEQSFGFGTHEWEKVVALFVKDFDRTKTDITISYKVLKYEKHTKFTKTIIETE